MTKTLRKNSQKKSKLKKKKFFRLKVIWKVKKSFPDKKNFLILDFFCEFFLSVLVIFYGKKISCLKMIFGPS